METKDCIKITVDVRMMWNSGIGSYIRHLVPRVMKILPRARFFLLGRPEEMEQWEGFRGQGEWISVKSPIYSVSEQVEIPKKIPRETDLYWTPHYPSPVLWNGRLLATVHDVFHLAMGRMAGGIQKRLYARFMFQRLARKANAVLCVSQFVKNELISRVGMPPEKIRVIHNGVDENWFKVKHRKNLEIKPYLLFVGNIKPHKNLGRLLEAFGLIKDRTPHDLILVGRKAGFITDDRTVFKKAQSMGGRVRFTGAINNTLLGQYYAFADLLVLPSLYEGFGLPPLEAMACGTAVAVSRIAALQEVCGNAAVYFDPYQPEDIAAKMLKVLHDAKLRKTMADKGLRQAKKFRWDDCAKETSRVLRCVLEGASRA
jgi:glycosyltransferase involved in cell wall biosynthesis